MARAPVATPDKLGRCAESLAEPPQDLEHKYEVGVEFLNYLRVKHGSVPVVVYSADWANLNRGREGEYGVRLISNSTPEVYRSVLKILSETT